jgi:MFS family permease
MSDAAAAPDTQFRWYLAGAGSWFVAFGIQAVMFAYLVTTVLHAPANQIGLAQASLTLVSTILLLVGGAVADQIDTRRLLLFCHAAAIVPALALAGIVYAGLLRYEWLIAYGLGMGLITAFILPAREAMMGDVIGPHGGQSRIQRAVTTTVGITFLAQIAGMLVARFAAVVGAAPIILLQVAAQAFGAFTAYRLAPSTRHHVHAQSNGGSQRKRIAAGLREVTSSYALLPVTILTLAIGVLFIGAFLVILPVLLRDEFGGDVQQFSTMQVSFWGGSIISSLAISRVGNIVHRGRFIVGALSMGILILTIMSIKGPLIALYALVFVWGLGAGVTISMSRTIVQEHAPPAHRARVLSIYQLGFTGGMSIGALFIGFIVEALGPRLATLVPAGLMALVLIGLLAMTKLWHINALKHDTGKPA